MDGFDVRGVHDVLRRLLHDRGGVRRVVCGDELCGVHGFDVSGTANVWH
jgi:hypothetical protein